MKISQIAIFMENKPGHLRTVCRSLAEAGVNITTLSLADTSQYGILRLLANDWEKARDALIQAGFVVNVTEVLAVEVDDKPGGLLALLDIVGELEVNIEYMYPFTRRRGENAVIVFRFDDPDRAITALRSKNVRILSSSEVLG